MSSIRSSGGTLVLPMKNMFQNPRSPSFERFLDPDPDWTWEELRKELDAMAILYEVPVLSHNINLPPNPNGFSRRDLSVPAKSGRTNGMFLMPAFGGSDTEDSGEEEEKVEPPTCGEGSDVPRIDGTRFGNGTTSAESKDMHLLAIQRDHELRSRFDALQIRAEGDAPRQEIAAREEKDPQATARVEAEEEAEAGRKKADAEKEKSNVEVGRKKENAEKENTNVEAGRKKADAEKEGTNVEVGRKKADAKIEKSNVEAGTRNAQEDAAATFASQRVEGHGKRKADAQMEKAWTHKELCFSLQTKKKAGGEVEKAEVEVATKKAQADMVATAALQSAVVDQEGKAAAELEVADIEMLEAEAQEEEANVAAEVPTGTKPRVAPTAAKLELPRRKITIGREKKLRELQEAFAPLQATTASQKADAESEVADTEMQEAEALEEEANVELEKTEAQEEEAKVELEKADAKAAAEKAQAEVASQRADGDGKRREELEQSAHEKNPETEQPAAEVPTGTKPRVAPTAAKLEEARKKKLQELQEVFAPLQAATASQKELKICERLIIKHLQQIAATQQQVQKKSMDLLQLLHDPSSPTQFLIATLGAKLLSQCECQILRLPSFAFALAQVTVNVASEVPYAMDAILAKLHEACIFTVPKYYEFSKDQFESDAAYYKALGYREEDGKLESTDDYVARMSAYMTFYGALVQTNATGGQNPHGLADGWAWLARFLNHIPANRSSASALEAVLKMAGFRLHQVYPKPFLKVMQTSVTGFIANLKTAGDPDSRAVVSRIETYLYERQYLIEPEGRTMPITDISASLKA